MKTTAQSSKPDGDASGPSNDDDDGEGEDVEAEAQNQRSEGGESHRRSGRGSRGGGKGGRGRRGGGSSSSVPGKTCDLSCGRCLADYGPEVPWVLVPGPNHELIPAGTACGRCWKPFGSCWQKLGFTWSQICGKCAEDSEFNDRYEQTCQISGGEYSPDWDGESISQDTEIGYEVSLNFALLKEQQIQKAGCQGFSIKQLGEKVAELPSPFGGKSPLQGVIVKHPEEAYINVKVFNRVILNHGVTQMGKGDQVMQDQPQKYSRIYKRN